MIYLLFGDRDEGILNRLGQLREEIGGEFIELSGINLEKGKLLQTFETKSLFEEKRTVILSDFLESLEDLKNLNMVDEFNLILCEKKKLTQKQKTIILELFKKVKVEEYSQPLMVFKFLESIKPNNTREMLALFHQYLKSEAVEVIFVMIVRQIRLLLLCKASERQSNEEWKTLSSWQASNFEQQAKYFDELSLKKLLRNLLEIDFNIKSGNELNLEGCLDSFLLSI